MNFKPFNWYSAGLVSPVEYYKLALQYEHNFNIVLYSTIHSGNIYRITGKCLFNNYLNDFKTDIIKDFNGISAQNEGDFTMNHNGIVYRIATTIYSTTYSNINTYEFNKDPVNTINLDIPKDVIKMAMIVLCLDI